MLNFTFEECADLAEHFHNDLGIDRAMLVLNGWINGGYDNKHPDILPAAEAIGGNAGLAACATRTKKLGWLFGLHDNYADMYQAAPSWDESYLMRNPDGSLRKGGVWAGGQCWLICSKRAVELASRPQNIPGVKELCAPDIYFSDVIFATPLYECHAVRPPHDHGGRSWWPKNNCATTSARKSDSSAVKRVANGACRMPITSKA